MVSVVLNSPRGRIVRQAVGASGEDAERAALPKDALEAS